MQCVVTHEINRHLDAIDRQNAADDRIQSLADDIMNCEELSVRITPTTEKGRRMWMVDVIDTGNAKVVHDDLAEWFDTIALAADAGERLLERCAEAEARRRLAD